MRGGRRMLCAGTIAVALALARGELSAACSLDGVPSLSVNGRLVQPMTAKPSRAELATWAPFAVPDAFHAGRSVQFSERVPELKRSLPPPAFAYPWRWQFGDGSTTTGTVVTHAYRRPGLYRVTVWADYRAEHFWYEFDAAMIRIR